MDQGKGDELLQKAVLLYVGPQHREAALLTFRQLVEAARYEGATTAVAQFAPMMRRAGK